MDSVKKGKSHRTSIGLKMKTCSKLKLIFTFLKAATGAISAPFRVLKRNMGQEEAFILNPAEKDEWINKKLNILL